MKAMRQSNTRWKKEERSFTPGGISTTIKNTGNVGSRAIYIVQVVIVVPLDGQICCTWGKTFAARP